MPTESSETAPKGLHIVLTREMFSIFMTIHRMDNDQSEELEIEEVRKYLYDHGGDQQMVDEAMDQCWNFLLAELLIANPKEPVVPKLPYAPEI